MQTHDQTIPILPSRSLEQTLVFYRKLGFSGEIIGGAYAILLRGSAELHFFLHAELVPESSAAGCYLRSPDVQSLYDAFARATLPSFGIPRMDGLQAKAWGMREFAIVDEDGNLVRIGQIL